MASVDPNFWTFAQKPDAMRARRAFIDWWDRKGMVLWLSCPKEGAGRAASPPDLQTQWLDADWRLRANLSRIERTFFGGDAFPTCDVDIGPGSLGLFLGCEGELAHDTVWYHAVISDPDAYEVGRIDTEGVWWRRHMALIDAAAAAAPGKFLVGMPDLIENLDTLGQLRGNQELMMDLAERPRWVARCIRRINDAFYEAFDRMYAEIEAPGGGNLSSAFRIWGPGKTVKVQCDLSCAISERMFRDLVMPSLREQCQWLDYSLYHLDGTQAMHHLPALLAIDELDAIEWTPQAGIDGGGHPRWYELYKKIKSAGKCVQAVGVKIDEIEPLIDAVGPEGLYIMCGSASEAEARKLLDRLGYPSSN